MPLSICSGKKIALGDGEGSGPTISARVRRNDRRHEFPLPTAPGLTYHFMPTFGTESFEVACDHAKVQTDSAGSTLARLFLDMTVHGPHRKVAFDGFRLAVSGPRPARKQFYAYVSAFRSPRGEVDGRLLGLREMTEGWSSESFPPVGDKVALGGGRKAAIVCHVYYMDVIEEIAALIASRRQRFDVIVTMPLDKESCRRRVEALIPGARVLTFENMGRDIRPFLKILEQGLLDGYDLVCKIHGKTSRGGDRSPLAGDAWRRRALFDLLGDQRSLDHVLQRFADDPTIGMIGPAICRCPGPAFDEAIGWKGNRERVLELAERMGAPKTRFVLDFFAGTMFWTRREALEPLRRLALADSYFEPECGLLDGGPEHAVERTMGASVTEAGYRLENVNAADRRFSGQF